MVDWSGFFPGIVDSYNIFNSKHYAAPIDFFIEVLAYRKDLFEKAGSSSPPKTWDEFKAYAAKLNDPKAGGSTASRPCPQSRTVPIRMDVIRPPASPCRPMPISSCGTRISSRPLPGEATERKALIAGSRSSPYGARRQRHGLCRGHQRFCTGPGGHAERRRYAFFSDIENPRPARSSARWPVRFRRTKRSRVSGVIISADSRSPSAPRP